MSNLDDPTGPTGRDLNQFVQAAAQRVTVALGLDPIECSYDFDLTCNSAEVGSYSESQIVVRTDIVQKIASQARLAEVELAAKALEILHDAGHRESLITQTLAWSSRDRFLNLVPRADLIGADAQRAGTFFETLRSSALLPTRVFVLRPPQDDPGGRRLAARLAAQFMALRLLGREPKLLVLSFDELERFALENDLNSELSNVWLFPQSAPKARLAPTLQRLGAQHRALVESITSDEWGPVDSLPALGALSVGQTIALAEYNLVSEVDVVGAGRREVQNLPWLLSSVAARLAEIFRVEPKVEPKPEPSSENPPLFAEVMRDLALRDLALVGAARGRVGAYFTFWREVVTRVMRIVNNPTIRQRINAGAVTPYDLACSSTLISILSENAAAWENNLQHELILQ